MRFSLFAHMERWDDQVSHREHHSMEYTTSPNPMPLLAYLAGKTTTIRLGAGTIIAPFWNPIRAAGECALLDVISGDPADEGRRGSRRPQAQVRHGGSDHPEVPRPKIMVLRHTHVRAAQDPDG